jgi:deoxyribonuclease (pyrimidine dimer)
MTRINVIPPEDLTDQHLIAEYRELPRVFALARHLAPREVVPTYRLGSGHVKFFYPLTGWLAARQAAIIAECFDRQFEIQHTSPPDPVPGLDGDWTPTPEARAENIARLRAKLHARPGFYRFRGELVGPDFYDQTDAGYGGEE